MSGRISRASLAGLVAVAIVSIRVSRLEEQTAFELRSYEDELGSYVADSLVIDGVTVIIRRYDSEVKDEFVVFVDVAYATRIWKHVRDSSA